MTRALQPNVPIPQVQQEQLYGIEIEGGWGEFYTASSKVLYVSSNARFTSNPNNDFEHSLLKHMTPVREIIKTKDVAFSELLQRDLDDFRVSNEMVPYLLGPSNKGPVFFPPILAVLIPYKNGEPDAIETIEVRHADKDAPEQERKFYEDLVAGPVFKLSRFVSDVDGSLNRTTRHAKLRWNDSRAKLVVIDGQHRAMALLAIYRSVRKAWENQSGSEYKHFYSEKIDQLLAENTFPEIEVPVTIAIFPELFGARGPEIHTAARKLFVDVNKEAKPPSNSRLILLSDQDLINVLTRMFLEKVRDRDNLLKKEVNPQIGSLLATIEYDSHSSSKNEYAWHRPTSMTNLNLLRFLIEISVARHSRFRERIDAGYKGDKGPHFDHVKDCLELEQKLGQYPKILVDGVEAHLGLENLRLDECPPQIQNSIFEIFYEKIGKIIDGVFRGAQPYSAHVVSTELLKSRLGDVSLEEKLVRQSLFDGVGTYWTLKNFGEQFENKIAGINLKGDRRELEKNQSPSVKSWREVEKAKELLLKEVAQQLLGNIAKDDVDHVKALKAKTETIACEIGLLMTAMHIQALYKLQSIESESFVEIFCKYINKAQSGDSVAGAKRALVMTGDPKQDSLFNFLSKLNPNNWIEFRWLWIELLAENQSEFEAEMKGKFQSAANVSLTGSIEVARKGLYTLFAKEIKKKHKDDWKDNKDELAADLALRKRFAAMEYWLDWSKEKFFEEYKAVEVNGKWARVDEVNSTSQVPGAPNDDQENGDDEEVDEEN